MLYVVMTLHLLTIDNTLSEEHEEIHEGRGRYVMAAAAVMGWCIGSIATAPKNVEALLLAFVSGGVMVNSMIGELSSNKNVHILPFVLGSAIYGVILMQLG